MRLTTKGRFAVTAMIDLAEHQGEMPVSLARIAERQDISFSYLEQLFGKLRRYALVNSMRGPGGGYRLARDSSEITVAEIVIAVDEPLDATSCGGKQNCRDAGRCRTHHLWSNLNKRIYAYLDSVTLLDLVDGRVQPESGDVEALRKVRRRGRSANWSKSAAASPATV